MAGIDLTGKANLIWGSFSEWGADNFGDDVVSKGAGLIGGGIDPNLINAGSQVLGSLLGGGGGGSSASSSSSQYVNFNSSGYTVATSGSKAQGSSAIPWYVWLIGGVVAVAGFKAYKKAKA